MGLAHAPSAYREFSGDAYYVVGTSRPERDWPYVHPGPSDAWAGSTSHTFTVWFGLEARPALDCTLVLDLLDTHGSVPPQLLVDLNGVRIADVQTPHGSGDERALEGDFGRGKSFVSEVRLPHEHLTEGDNVLTITNAKGSWVVYDSLRMEAPDGTTLKQVTPHLSVEVLPTRAVIYRTPEGPRQQVAVRVTYRGEPTKAYISVDGATPMTADIHSGAQTLRAMISAAASPRTVGIEIRTESGMAADQQADIEPVRQWDVYILPHSHVDVGYTSHQSVALKTHQKNILDAALLAKATSNYPEGARFRWNCETFWALDDLLHTTGDSEWQEIAPWLWNGSIHPDASYAHLLSGLARPEELLRSFRMSRMPGPRSVPHSDAAMLVDVPGASWGMVTAMAHAGIRYLLLAPNNSDRIGRVRVAWENKPFYWVSPSGKEEVLVWQTEPYSLGTFLKTGPNGWGYSNVDTPPEPIRSHDPMKHFLEPWLFEKLSALEREQFPYDMLLITWALADNSPIDPDLPDAVRRWNEMYESPRLVIATTSEAMRAFERRHGSRVPHISGDYSPYWEEGAASSARETALNRASADRLVQAETLWAMLDPDKYPSHDFLDAWRNVLLYTEHTWGAHSSVWDPDSDFVRKQWETKQRFALDADEQSRRLLSQALSERDGNDRREIDVFNTSSWARTDLVSLPRDWSLARDRVEDADGKPVPSQRLSSGELVFIASDVPALGAKRFRVVAGEPYVAQTATAEGLSVQNDTYRVTLDEVTGDIASILRIEDGRELVDGSQPYRFNQYLYVRGADIEGASTSGTPKIEVVERGPLVATLRVISAAPGARYLVREVRVMAGMDRVDIMNKVWKRPVREKEGVHFAFPFSVEGGQVRFDTAWAVVTPETVQLPGANKNFLSVQRWVDVSNTSHGITLTTSDAPLIELGGLWGNLIGSQTNPEAWLEKLTPTQTIYSWVMNNHWHTNYRADQEGEVTFRYSLRAHDAYDSAAATRFGVEASSPLIVAPAAPGKRLSLPFGVQAEGAIVTALKPSDIGRGWILRLYAASGQDEKVRILWKDGRARGVWTTDAREMPMGPSSGEITVPAWGVRTLYIER